MKKVKNNNGHINQVLTNFQNNKLEVGIKQLNEGKGIPIKKAAAYLSKKYGLS